MAGRNPDLLKLQQSIKNNSMNMQDYLSDLSQWTQEITVKEQKTVYGKGTGSSTANTSKSSAANGSASSGSSSN